MPHELPPPVRMLQLITGYWISQAVGTAAKLGLADQLADGPRSAEDVATRVRADSQMDALRGRAKTDTDVARLIAPIDAVAFQLDQIYTYFEAPAPFPSFKKMGKSVWTNELGWSITRAVDLDSLRGATRWVIHERDNWGKDDQFRGAAKTLAAAKRLAWGVFQGDRLSDVREDLGLPR